MRERDGVLVCWCAAAVCVTLAFPTSSYSQPRHDHPGQAVRVREGELSRAYADKERALDEREADALLSAQRSRELVLSDKTLYSTTQRTQLQSRIVVVTVRITLYTSDRTAPSPLL
jgi:hypothetical protein